jgi:uncharacterized protein
VTGRGVADGAEAPALRVTLRVRPGAGRTKVGGEHGGSLVVRVAVPAVLIPPPTPTSDGRATEAALAAVATAFGVRRPAVTLVTGATSRTKVVDVAGGDPAVLARLLVG